MSLNFYPAVILDEDLSPDIGGEEVDAICNEIHESCAGFGTDEDRLLKVMGSLTPELRCQVPARYEELFGKNLRKVMKSECGRRDFGTALQFLALPPDELDVYVIEKALDGKNDLFLLATVLCGRTNLEMELLKKKYFAMNEKDIAVLLDKELGKDYEKLIFYVIQAAEESYDPDYHTDEKVVADVQNLFEMGQGDWFGTDERGVIKMMCTSPPEHLAKVADVYAEQYGKTLEKALKSELGGKFEDALLFHVNMKIKPIDTIAGLIDEACKGFGTKEVLLTSTLIRYQLVLKYVMYKYVELYETTVKDRVSNDTGGEYSKLLMEILNTVELPAE